MNGTPRITSAIQSNPLIRRNDCSAVTASLNIMANGLFVHRQAILRAAAPMAPSAYEDLLA